MLRVLLLEDEALLRLTLASTLPDETMKVVGAFADAKSAVAAAGSTPFDVLVTDLDLLQGPGPNGIVVANVVRRSHPDAGIVLLTSYADPRLIGAKLNQVPEGTEYVRKQDVTDIEVLRAAVRRSVLGTRDLGVELPAVALTDTQIETMRLVAQGLSNAAIARQRVVTERAVEMSLYRIARNLGYSGDATQNTRALIVRAYYAMTGSGNARDKTPT
ncbi:MAG: response regulator [Gaiellales bacterium]